MNYTELFDKIAEVGEEIFAPLVRQKRYPSDALEFYEDSEEVFEEEDGLSAHIFLPDGVFSWFPGTLTVSITVSEGEVNLWTRIGESCVDEKAFAARRKAYDTSDFSSRWRIWDTLRGEGDNALALFSTFKGDATDRIAAEIKARLQILVSDAFGVAITPLAVCYK
ncbi:MAG: hypothetical protein E7624_04255 [Ruminococcaceae bacterium]|nr:hypothetical protein [Oscillospiraceae bacterium]